MDECLVALDPGTHTGIAIYYPRSNEWDQYEYGPEPHHKRLYELLIVLPSCTLVCENFVYQPRTKVVLDSVEYIGVAKLFSQTHNTPLVLQTAAQGKAFWSDDKIRKLNLWLPNSPHAMDATRHALYYWMTRVDNRFVEKLAGD